MPPTAAYAQPEAAPMHVESAPVALHAEPPSRLEQTLAESTPTLPRNAPEIPRVSLDLPPGSDLVLVETSHAASLDADQPEAPRTRRVRPPRTQVADEPLQMVETTHKDSTPPA
jgi:hypothetical protein